MTPLNVALLAAFPAISILAPRRIDPETLPPRRLSLTSNPFKSKLLPLIVMALLALVGKGVPFPATRVPALAVIPPRKLVLPPVFMISLPVPAFVSVRVAPSSVRLHARVVFPVLLTVTVLV